METIEKSINVAVPVSTVYNQWTQFESFPQFMAAVKEVRQLDDKRLHWKAEIAGRTKEWDAEIFEQIPDQRIAWRSFSGAKNSGMVNFAAIGPEQTQVNLQLHYDPEGTAEQLGDALGVVSARIGTDLRRFKKFIEKRRDSTGGWRGQIHGRDVYSAGRLD